MATQTNVAVTQGSGKNIDGYVTSTAGNVRQTVVIGDPSTDNNIVNVLADGSIKTSVYGNVGASMIGTVPVTQSGTWSVSMIGATTSVLQLGTWSVSVVGGTASVLQIGTWSVSVVGATVQGLNAPAASITGNPVYVGGKDANGSVAGTQVIGGALQTFGSISGTAGASVIGTVPVTQSGTWSQSVVGATASVQQIGTWSVSVVGGTASVLQLGTWSVSVVGGTASVMQIGTWSVSVVGGTASVLQLGTWNVNAASSVVGATGSVAGISSVGGAVSENPVNVGGKAVNAEQTAVANGNKVQFVADLVGKLINLPYSNPENMVNGVTSVITGTTAVSVLGAPGSGLRNYITGIQVTNGQASVTGAGTFVDIKDSGANILWSGYAAAGGGGFAPPLLSPLRQLTTNASVDVVCRNQASVIAALTGYKGI